MLSSEVNSFAYTCSINEYTCCKFFKLLNMEILTNISHFDFLIFLGYNHDTCYNYIS